MRARLSIALFLLTILLLFISFRLIYSSRLLSFSSSISAENILDLNQYIAEESAGIEDHTAPRVANSTIPLVEALSEEPVVKESVETPLPAAPVASPVKVAYLLTPLEKIDLLGTRLRSFARLFRQAPTDSLKRFARVCCCIITPPLSRVVESSRELFPWLKTDPFALRDSYTGDSGIVICVGDSSTLARHALTLVRSIRNVYNSRYVFGRS